MTKNIKINRYIAWTELKNMPRVVVAIKHMQTMNYFVLFFRHEFYDLTEASSYKFDEFVS